MSSRRYDTTAYRSEYSGEYDLLLRQDQGYVYGSALPEEEPWYGGEEEWKYRELEEERESRRRAVQRRREEYLEEQARREQHLQERRHAQAMIRVSALVTILMMTVLTAAIIGYVRLMSSVSVSNNRISSLQAQIEKQKTLNDQRQEEIDSSVNLEEIKSIAINELGMKYADENQIQTYSSQSDDYVHQVAEVGD